MNEQLDIDFDADLTAEERAVLGLIEPGRARALPVNVLALLSGLHERRVRQVVRHLIDAHGACIGSATAPPCGYYIITDPEEIDRTYQQLRHRGISILTRAARLKRTSLVEVFGQEILRND